MTLPDSGIEVELVVRGQQPLTVWLADSNFGLPPTADVLVAARPDDAVPVHRGDRTLVYRRTSI